MQICVYETYLRGKLYLFVLCVRDVFANVKFVVFFLHLNGQIVIAEMSR